MEAQSKNKNSKWLNKTIGSIVADDYRTAAVFASHKIDFCCKGQVTIDSVCNRKQMNLNEILNELDEATHVQDTSGIDFKSWPLDLLADYIEKKHHRYVENTLPTLLKYLDKVCLVHGDHHPELREVFLEFSESAKELSAHMKKEELILFPYVRKILAAQMNSTNFQSAHFGSVQNPIKMMMAEHDKEGDRFRKISELTNGYTPPEEACNTYRVSFSLLQEFENDLHQHIHLENNILFLKAIEMEAQLLMDMV